MKTYRTGSGSYKTMKFHGLSLLLLLCCCCSYGQTSNYKDQLLNIKSSYDSLTKNFPGEKLYLQTDKPNYAVGDTLWFKAYLFHAPTLALSAKSGVIYIDIANDSNKVVKQVRLAANQGLGWGNISLSDFPAGNYVLRAYTTWMRNFGEDCFFYQRFVIASEPQDDLQVNDAGNPSAIKRREARAKIKLEKRISQVDVQFLPEGGSLIAGLPGHIGFKAIGGDGRGVNVSGTIVDNENQQVAAFSSLHLGMGSFNLHVKPGEHYTAKVNLPGGTIKEYPLPSIKNSGTVLNVVNTADKDSISISIAATNDLVQSGNSYFLIGKARNVICYAAVINFSGAGNIRRDISKSLFPSGITHFILMNAQWQPLNERLVFVNHEDNLHFEIKTDKHGYQPHDSVAMQISVSDVSGNPVKGNFSLAVTDDAQVNIDSLQDNITSHILLSSELKGYLEQPGFYFEKGNWAALDNLLLTQGWVNYDWPFDPPKTAYLPEQELAVKGRVLNGFGKSVKATRVTLLSKSPLLSADTLTDNEGRFTFNHFPQIDTPAFFLKAVNRGSKSFNVGIVMDDYQPPLWNIHPVSGVTDTLPDTGLVVAAKNNRIRKEQVYLTPSGHLLKEVKITAKKIVKDSQNLNGPGNADLVLDETDLIKEGKKNWLDILMEKIPGFATGNIRYLRKRFFVQHKLFFDARSAKIDVVTDLSPGSSFFWFVVDNKPVKFIIDGEAFGVNISSPDLGTPSFTDITNFLKSHNAEDIKGIELNNTLRYSGNYLRRFIPPDWPEEWQEKISSFDCAFIEITTRSGHGLQLDNTPGAYLYKPLPIIQPKQFYSPRYTVSDTAKHLPDTRSTIYWQPNVNTDADGRAIFSFYTADKPATYTIIIQGTDMNGGLGYKKRKMQVKKQKVAGK